MIISGKKWRSDWWIVSMILYETMDFHWLLTLVRSSYIDCAFQLKLHCLTIDLSFTNGQVLVQDTFIELFVRMPPLVEKVELVECEN
jgi:hypothetical protein